MCVEVGSTITKVNVFAIDAGLLRLVAQGFAATTVASPTSSEGPGDVTVGVLNALSDAGLSEADLASHEVFVNSSAAGGLRMTVHGLTRSMTARAAHEASLGAGAIARLVTAGELDADTLDQIRAVRPTIMLLAGGVDDGEKRTVVANAEALASLNLGVPVVYAGNVAARAAVRRVFAGQDLLVADNVFPDVDVLNIEPLRALIQQVFNATIVHAPGMERLAELVSVSGNTTQVLPTPGAVLRASEIFADAVGDVVTVDVGGATTDVHSVTDGSPEFTRLMTDPEPRAKRTVEGDLGVFVNAATVAEASGDPDWPTRLDELAALPVTEGQRELTRWLTARAAETAVRRHAGRLLDLYTPTGKKQVVRGKDLTAVGHVVATGGALTRVPGAVDILARLCTGPGEYLLPRPGVRVHLDRDYLFSALGTIAVRHPALVSATLASWAQEDA
ncbi:MAG TPA: glutamate mutase L [Propionibacteriaceae bacterium]|nr:glutamate mutase L [Propionibacteriaceae bacterium]